MAASGKYRLLAPGDTFPFTCKPECWGRCCAATTIRVDPWDLLRIARGVGVATSELLKICTFYRGEKHPLPVVCLVRRGRCPFLSGDGRCLIYRCRPRVCRAFPVGEIVEIGDDGRLERGYLLMHAASCQGFDPKAPRYRPAEWLAREGVAPEDMAQTEQFLRFLREAKERLAWSVWLDETGAWTVLRLLYDPDGWRERCGVGPAVSDALFWERSLKAAWWFLAQRAAHQDIDAARIGEILRGEMKAPFPWEGSGSEDFA